MDKAINTTLIIGNGFDLSMGKHTGYAEFFKKLEDEGFWEEHSGKSHHGNVLRLAGNVP